MTLGDANTNAECKDLTVNGAPSGTLDPDVPTDNGKTTDTWYQNTSGDPIVVYGEFRESIDVNTGGLRLSINDTQAENIVDGVVINDTEGKKHYGVQGIVPDGAYYRVHTVGDVGPGGTTVFEQTLY